MENKDSLAYWKLRTVEARNACDDHETPINCEELAFTRCMVKLIEVEKCIGKVENEKVDCVIANHGVIVAGMRNYKGCRSIAGRYWERLARCFRWLSSGVK